MIYKVFYSTNITCIKPCAKKLIVKNILFTTNDIIFKIIFMKIKVKRELYLVSQWIKQNIWIIIIKILISKKYM